MSKLRLKPIATPSTPPTDKVDLYIDTADGKLKHVDDADVVTSYLEDLGYVPEDTASFSKMIYKSADETVNNSNSLQDDNALVLPVGANEVWSFIIYLKYSSGTTPSFKGGFSYPAGALIDWGLQLFTQNLAIETDVKTFTSSGASTKKWTQVFGVIENSSTPGNMIFRWSQNTADLSDTKVYKGSHIIARKLA